MSSLTLSAPVLEPNPNFSSKASKEDQASLSTPSDPEAQTGDQHAAPRFSRLRKNFLLALFSVAQFIDIFSATSAAVAIPVMSQALGLTPSTIIWFVNAYALTLASFLLTAGRVADISSPKWVFIIGLAFLGVINLGIGFVETPIQLFVLRAISGIGAAATIPAALSLIVHIFEENEQELAIGIFGGSGALANVLGLLIGAVLLLASWPYIYYFIAIVCIPLAVGGIFLIPNIKIEVVSEVEGLEPRQPKMDWLGTVLQTAAIVLIVYAFTEANVKGWKSAGVLSTLLIGLALFPVFGWWQSKIDPRDALLLPSLWRIPNFALLAILGLVPYSWWFVVQVAYSEIMQSVWGDSGILTAVRLLPIGVVGVLGIVGTSALPPTTIPLRVRLVTGALLAAVGSLILAFAHETHDYARLMIPGFVLGTFGTGVLFVSINTSLVMSVPPQHVGVAGGVFNSALQLGITIVLSISTTIQIAYPSHVHAGASPKGYQSSFFFLMAVNLLAGLLAAVLFVNPIKKIRGEKA